LHQQFGAFLGKDKPTLFFHLKNKVIKNNWPKLGGSQQGRILERWSAYNVLEGGYRDGNRCDDEHAELVP
jgi:hypothetical protein